MSVSQGEGCVKADLNLQVALDGAAAVYDALLLFNQGPGAQLQAFGAQATCVLEQALRSSIDQVAPPPSLPK